MHVARARDRSGRRRRRSSSRCTAARASTCARSRATSRARSAPVGHLAALRRTHERAVLARRGGGVRLHLRGRCAGDAEAARRSRSAVIPIERALSAALPRALLDAEGEVHARHGRPVPLAHVRDSGGVVLEPPREPLLLCAPAARVARTRPRHARRRARSCADCASERSQFARARRRPRSCAAAAAGGRRRSARACPGSSGARGRGLDAGCPAGSVKRCLVSRCRRPAPRRARVPPSVSVSVRRRASRRCA